MKASPVDAVEGPLAGSQEPERVRRMIGLLPDAHREVLVLVAWEGLSCEDVALVLGVEIGTGAPAASAPAASC